MYTEVSITGIQNDFTEFQLAKKRTIKCSLQVLLPATVCR